MQLPNLSALRARERKREEDVGGNYPDEALPYLSGPSAVLTALSDMKKYLYPFASCEDSTASDSKTLTATSELWKQRLFNTSTIMKNWNHKDRLDEIRDFFKAAGEAEVDSLAHVVLVRKQYDKTDFYPEGCKSTTGINSCYHGHIAVVFEPLFQPSPDIKRDVVSLGFYPRSGDARNLIPGYVSDGALQSPDKMVKDWRQDLAQGSVEADMADHVVILDTFLYAPEKMAEWAEVMQRRVEQLRWEAKHEGIHDVLYADFAFYSGVAAVEVGMDTITSLVSSLRAVTKSISYLSYLNDNLPEASRSEKAFNCATWMLDAFPEANVVCTAGIPRLCRRKGDLFKPLEDGLLYMQESATEIAKNMLQRSTTDAYEEIPDLEKDTPSE